LTKVKLIVIDQQGEINYNGPSVQVEINCNRESLSHYYWTQY